MKRIVYGLSAILAMAALTLTWIKLIGESSESELVKVRVTDTPTRLITETTTPIPKVTATPTAALLVPTPTIIPPVSGYVLDQEIDLSSGRPVALTIRLSDGSLLSSNWAGTVSYQETDDQGTVFEPENGVIYSYLGDVTTTWAHSGTTWSGQRFFASNLELYLRKDEETKKIESMTEVRAKAKSLIGSTAYLCQDGSGEAIPLSDYDALKKCDGKLVEMEVVAFAVVSHEKLAEYDEAILNFRQWLMENYPDAGFDEMSPDNGWIIRFCIGQLSDQASDGSEWYLYNRGVIGFRVKDMSGETMNTGSIY